MDSLVLLYLLLLVAFSLHDFEEILFQHSWVLKNQNRIVKKFPFAKNILEHLAKLDTKKFAVIAFEEFCIILFGTILMLAKISFWQYIEAALLFAFGIHLIIHLLQAILVKGYVPGLVSSLLLLPYGYFSTQLIVKEFQLKTFFIATIGTALMILNLKIMHRATMKN